MAEAEIEEAPKREKTPRELLEDTVWSVLREAYLRVATENRIPKRPADQKAVLRPWISAMKMDHQALMACVDHGAVLEYHRIAAVVPEPPEVEAE